MMKSCVCIRNHFSIISNIVKMNFKFESSGKLRLIWLSFSCRGKDLRMTNLNQGFTHVFESIFENVEGVAEYGTHPAHLELKDRFLALLDKILVLDYELATLNP